MRKFPLTILCTLMTFFTFAQTPDKPTSAQIYESIEKLNFLGSVLYVAAHPDDENTNLISYFSNQVHARTAYIALTRGDGGQNLIGPELRELLGVIRTQELLQARKTDGGIQFFSRANDFGYSKNPDETFKFWDKEQVLGDLVYVIRKFQPDIIINRFDYRTPGTTHGHHTASAILSKEAFDLTGDPTKFPEQLKRVNPWQPKRLLFNDSWFFYPSVEAFEKADKSGKFSMDIGSYYPASGLSNSEIAANSRSKHRSQGFGTMAVRGKSMEYLEPLRGGMPAKHLFEGIDTTWNRIKGGKAVGEILENVQKNFDFKNPAASVPELMKAYQLLQNTEDRHWKPIKLQEIKNIITACAGLFLEASAASGTAVAGEETLVNLEATNRSNVSIILKSISLNKDTFSVNQELGNNELHKFSHALQIPAKEKPTTPYWLEEQGSLGMYKVSNPDFIGLPEAPVPFTATFNLVVNGIPIEVTRPVIYKYNNPARGEVYKPFVVVPKASVYTEEQVLVFGDHKTKKVNVNVSAFKEQLKGELRLKAPLNWNITPEVISVGPLKKGESHSYVFEITPPKNQSETHLTPELNVDGELFSQHLIDIDYEHIPEQRVLMPGSSKAVRIDLKKEGNKIGYINGAGDSVADNLRQIGYEVEILDPAQITPEQLKPFDAVVLGVRAFNVLPELKFKNKALFDYVKNGGNLVVQYNVSHSLLTSEIAPYPLELSPDRVTEEDSRVSFVNPKSPVLNHPNKITEQDFEGWVQERGLYFPQHWDKAFTPVLSMHDEGESPLESSLLVAKYGKGYYVYTGLSFFRELPAGVPGAYRLLTNLLSLGK